MRKLIVLAAVFLIAVPSLIYAGKSLGWWPLINGFDISAHSSVSIGLAVLVAVLLRKLGTTPTYLSIIVPVMLIGVFWELGQLILNQTWYVSHYDMIKDVAIDFTGALIGATMVDVVQRGQL